MSFLGRFRRRRRSAIGQALERSTNHRRIPAGGPRFPHRADIVDAIQFWAFLYGAPPTYTDWSRSRAKRREDTAALERMGEPGDWPTARQVVGRFGTWNAALEAAGYTPRPAHRPRLTQINAATAA